MNQDMQSQWLAFREALKDAEQYGSGVWWDDEEIRDALHEAALKGIDIKLILACREACASRGDFLKRVRRLGGGKARILAVDDEEGFLDMLSLNLEDMGFEVRSVSDPRETLAVARDFLPDLVLLDIVMPDVDGLELLGQIRADDSLEGVQVIMLTALASDIQAGGVTEKGTLFLAKPVSMNRLVHCIREHLHAA